MLSSVGIQVYSYEWTYSGRFTREDIALPDIKEEKEGQTYGSSERLGPMLSIRLPVGVQVTQWASITPAVSLVSESFISQRVDHRGCSSKS